MKNLKKTSCEVEMNHSNLIAINYDWIDRIKGLAKKNISGKFRTCIHSSDSDNVHEMLIAHTSGTYVRPHKHRINGESLQFIEGKAIAILFNEDGSILKAFKVGDPLSSSMFYYSMKSSIYHMLIIESDFLIFKETTRGPFIRDDTVFPDWAPSGDNVSKTNEYIFKLKEEVKCLIKKL